MADSKRWLKIIIEGDCLNLISCLKESQSHCPIIIATIVNDIKEQASFSDSISFVHKGWEQDGTPRSKEILHQSGFPIFDPRASLCFL